MAPLAVYVHIPFCPSKCGYCDFNSYAMTGPIVESTCAAIVDEIAATPWRGRPAKTIFFGGGTPTFIPSEWLVRILNTVFEAHPPVEGCEVTSEANPGTVDADKFATMVDSGFNRLSLGAQSFLDTDLVRLGRVHRSGEIERAVGLAREAGFANLNLDLMFALPGQSLNAWRANLDRAVALEPDHLSLYCLTLEPNTPFYQEHTRGLLSQPDEDAQVAMYDLAVDFAGRAGLELYEISNFAKPGRECRHNLCYWRAEEYAGYGPGAVGLVDGVRYTNWKHPARYVDAVTGGAKPPSFESETIDEATRRTEAIMLGIRLAEGIDPGELAVSVEAVDKLAGRGWVERGDRIRLTPAGRHVCTEVAVELV